MDGKKEIWVKIVQRFNINLFWTWFFLTLSNSLVAYRPPTYRHSFVCPRKRRKCISVWIEWEWLFNSLWKMENGLPSTLFRSHCFRHHFNYIDVFIIWIHEKHFSVARRFARVRNRNERRTLSYTTMYCMMLDALAAISPKRK